VNAARWTRYGRSVVAGVIALAMGCVNDVRAADLDQGRILFVRHCASCHGTSGRGDGPDADIFPAPPRDLNTGVLATYDDATLARRIRSGRALPLVLDPAALRRHADDVDAILRHLRKLGRIDWPSVEPGWAAYVDRCEVCHGPTGDGPSEVDRDTRLPSLADAAFQDKHARSRMVDAVRHGRAGMPALDPPIDVAQAERIAAFVRLFSPGFTLYSRFCANCHADDGRGVGTLGEVPGDILPLPQVVFDDAYFTAHSAEHVRAKAWHMLETKRASMPHFRVVLGDADVARILGYLRSLARTPPRKP